MKKDIDILIIKYKNNPRSILLRRRGIHALRTNIKAAATFL
jgi:hypothetical protein